MHYTYTFLHLLYVYIAFAAASAVGSTPAKSVGRATATTPARLPADVRRKKTLVA